MAILKELQDFCKTVTSNFSALVDAQPEDQLKPPVITLLEAVGGVFGKLIITRSEVTPDMVQGRPDLGVTVSRLLAGFIELKAPGLGSNPSRLKGEQNKRQWENFKSIPNLIPSGYLRRCRLARFKSAS